MPTSPVRLTDACLLPGAWAHQSAWRVLEVSADSADNFLHTWAAWRADAQRCRMLHYVVLVSHHTALTQAAGNAHPDLAVVLAQQTWGLLPGMHRLAFEAGQLLLTVCVGDAEAFLRQQAWAFDSIYSPETTANLFKPLARCSAPNALLAVCASAPPPAKALAECGFTTPAPSLKNTIWHCRYAPTWTPRTRRNSPSPTAARCIVVGAGLSGASVAASLARRGWQVTVLDAGEAPAAGASGLPVGLFEPNVAVDDNPVARISRAGVRATWELCTRLLESGTDWLGSGVLEKRPPGQWGLPANWRNASDATHQPAADWGELASPQYAHAAGLAGYGLALHLHRAGWVKPAQLVHALLAQPEVCFKARQSLQKLELKNGQWQALGANNAVLSEAELVVVACGPASNALLQTVGLDAMPLTPVRGQLSWGLQADGMQLPQHPVNGHGALIAQVPVDGRLAWHAGSTFEHENLQLPVAPADQNSGHAANFQHLCDLLPRAAQALAPVFERGAPELRHWAGVRCTVLDRHPLVGPVAPSTHPGLWLCTGMGARGLSRAVLCGELLAATLHSEPLPLEAKLAAAMAADRFRAHRP